MKGEEAARKRLVALESRIEGLHPELPEKFWELREQIRRALELASTEGLLKQAIRDIRPPLFNSPKDPDPDGGADISGGDRAEKWEAANQLERSDGARFNFAVIVSYPKKEKPKLIAYHFNLAFPDERRPVMVRFDYNEGAFVTASRNAARSPLRCHSHPGHPDMTVPSPVLSPVEILDVILQHHLR